jgi:DNA-binding transcriptional MerR regulator
MLIGELVRKTGLSKDTIRFYEKHGLISVGRKERRDNNYKEYSEEVLARLLNIKHLKSFGFTLNECADVMEMIEANEATCRNLEGKIEEKVMLLQKKIDEMQQIKDTLLMKVTQCGSNCNSLSNEDNCPIVVPDIQA